MQHILCISTSNIIVFSETKPNQTKRNETNHTKRIETSYKNCSKANVKSVCELNQEARVRN